jgi:hypothetical protein
MKIITVTLGARGQQATHEGMIILGYTGPGGGWTQIGYMIRRPRAMMPTADGRTQEIIGEMPLWDVVAAELEKNMQRPEWPKFVRSKVQGNQIRISCPDEMNKAVFAAEFQPLDGQRYAHPDFVAIEDEGF